MLKLNQMESLLTAPPPKKSNKHLIVALIVVLAIIVVALIVFMTYPFVMAATNHAYRNISGLTEPKQEIITPKNIKLSGPDWIATAKQVATYEIDGLVVGVTDYNSSILYDRVVPRDVAIAWGEAAAHNNVISWDHGDREITSSYTVYASWVIDTPNEELASQYSNNHLVYENDNVKAKALKIQRGDHVKITGHLVDLTITDPADNQARYELTTSLLRNDYGDHSCEVILVSNIEIID